MTASYTDDSIQYGSKHSMNLLLPGIESDTRYDSFLYGLQRPIRTTGLWSDQSILFESFPARYRECSDARDLVGSIIRGFQGLDTFVQECKFGAKEHDDEDDTFMHHCKILPVQMCIIV